VEIDARYEFLDKVGSGSFATVYRARDVELGREVAVKQIHEQYLDDPEQLERYWQEAQLLASLHHPNIVTIFDIYRDRGWLILELMQSNLGERIAGRQMDLRALRTTLAHCLRALKYLHARGIIHGDIKPGNMMIDARRRVKIGDFGLARRVSDDEGSLLKGTTKYMAPEVVSDEFGEIGPASDLYSLGFAAYELMCGPNFESLFPGLSAFGRNKQVAWMMWHAAADRRLPQINRVLEGVPDDLQHVVQKLCQKDQSQRYHSAEEALSDLNIDIKVVPKQEQPASDDGAETPTGDPERKKRLLFAGGAVIVSLIVSLVILFLPSGEPPVQQAQYWTIRSVDTNKRELELVEFDGERAVMKAVDPQAIINLTRRGSPEPVPLERLRPGDRIQLERVSEDGKTVVRLKAARPVIDVGTDPKVDLQESVLTIQLEGSRAGESLSLRIPDRRHITVLRNLPRNRWETAETIEERDDLRSQYRTRLSSLGPEDRVEVSHLPDVGGRRGRVLTGVMFVYSLQTASGTVADVDAPRERMTVATDGRRINLPVHEEAEITLRDTDGTTTDIELAEMRKGDHVSVDYDDTFRVIRVIRSQGQATGSVTAVRLESRQFFVTVEADQNEVPFYVNGNSEIRIAGEPATLADLRAGDNVRVLYNAGTGNRSVATSVNATRGVQPDRRVLLIGVQTFADKALPGVSYAQPNADLLSEVLTRRYGVGRTRQRLIRVDENPTKEAMQRQVQQTLNRSGSGSQVIVYVATHGFVVDGRVYLAGHDLKTDNIAETGWPLDELLALMEQTGGSADKLLLLDISHTWEGRPPAKQPSTAEMVKLVRTPLKTTVVITGCSGEEHGVFHANGKHSVFAWFLAEGFKGAADADRNLHITADELFGFLSRRLSKADIESGRTQTPARFPMKPQNQ